MMKLFQKLIKVVSLLLLMLIVLVCLGKTIDLTGDNVNITSDALEITETGQMTLKSENNGNKPSITIINPNNKNNYCELTSGRLIGYSDGNARTIFNHYLGSLFLYGSNGSSALLNYNSLMFTVNGKTPISIDGDNGKIICTALTQTSKEENKKNFEKMQDNALEIIKNIDIYKYNLKGEEDETKKHIGFVIGDNYNYSEEVTSTNNDGADIYSFVSLCCKAIQEQQKQIEELQKEIKELKGGK